MFFGKRENQVQEKVKEHAALVGECLTILEQVIERYLAGSAEAPESSYRLHKTEHQADEVRREIFAGINEGAFLPFHREGYIRLAVLVDKIANRAVDFSKGLILEKPVFPAEYQAEFQHLAGAVRVAYEPMKQILDGVVDDPSTALNLATRVTELESETDSIEWKLLKRLFADPKIERVEKLVLRDAVIRLADVADKIENAADHVRVIVSKQAV